jgi:hypothetical protein
LIFFGLGDARDRDVVAVGAAAESSNSNKQVIEAIEKKRFVSCTIVVTSPTRRKERKNEKRYGTPSGRRQ